MLREVRMKLRAHQADFVIGANDGCAIGGGRAEHSLRQDGGQARRGAGAGKLPPCKASSHGRSVSSGPAGGKRVRPQIHRI